MSEQDECENPQTLRVGTQMEDGGWGGVGDGWKIVFMQDPISICG